jgi:phenylacetyl-CoA:acceptor oxidoreductase subunit 2
MKFNNYLQPNWDWRAAGNFMLGGTGGALMFMTALLWFKQMPPAAVSALALALVSLGLFLVWLEIGRPWRFINVFFHPQTSWMTREASVAVVLFVLAVAGIALHKPLVILLAGLAGLVFLFCQAQILRASKGIPAWREPAIVPLIMTTGFCEATAILSCIAHLLGTLPIRAVYLLIVLLVLRQTAWRIYRRRLAQAGAPQQTQRVLADIGWIQVFIGNLGPALLLIMALAGDMLDAVLLVSMSFLIVVSGWLMKFTIVARAAQVQGYALGKPRRGRPTLKPPVRRKA